MATAAFKSTTKRTPVGTSSTDDSSSSSLRHRRSRSLSRSSRTFSYRDNNDNTPKGRFVNTVRGSGSPEISLDDLAIEFFESANRARFGSGTSESEATPAAGGTASQRRGRSVSRKSSGAGDDRRSSIGGGARQLTDANSRRRRSVSVVRYQISDSESDLDHSQNSSNRSNPKNTDIGKKLIHKPVASEQRPVLRKSLSQKDFRSYDGYSSHSSVLTDDEGAGAHFSKSGIEKLQAAYAQKKVATTDTDKGLQKAMRKELRHLETEQVAVKPRISTLSTGDRMLSKNSNSSSIRRNYETELEQGQRPNEQKQLHQDMLGSEKRKQDLLAEIVFEEQRGRELSKIVSELSPAMKNNSIQKPSRARKRSNDRSRMSMRLTEEAERYIEDFISNVEDTDISSLDGERSDTSSSLGGLIKPETFNSPPMPRALPVLMDGVTLPWLQWETSNDASQITNLNKAHMLTPKIASSQVTLISEIQSQEEITKPQDQSNHSVSSRGSWSPDCLQEYVGKDVYSKFGEVYGYPDQSSSAKSKGLRYDIDEYLKVKSTEDLLIESWNQRQRINSGSLLICNLRLF